MVSDNGLVKDEVRGISRRRFAKTAVATLAVGGFGVAAISDVMTARGSGPEDSGSGSGSGGDGCFRRCRRNGGTRRQCRRRCDGNGSGSGTGN
jgi:hypothetical protein